MKIDYILSPKVVKHLEKSGNGSGFKNNKNPCQLGLQAKVDFEIRYKFDQQILNLD